MGLLEELKDRADKLDAEMLALSGRLKEIERESLEVYTCINALDLAEMDAEDEETDYPDFTPEQDAAIESATAEFQATDGAEIVSGEPCPEPAGEGEALPDGFTRWSSDPHADRGPQPSGDMVVIAWMGGDDFVGPLPAKDFDWEHDKDPVLGYKIITSGETQGTVALCAERAVSNAFPGSVEGSREPSSQSGYQHVVDAEPQLTDEVLEAITELAEAKLAEQEAELAPLFPPEPPPAATPEQLEATGVIDGTASWWARKLSKEPA